VTIKRGIALAWVLLAAAWLTVLVGWLHYGLVLFVDAVLAGIEDDVL